MESNYVHLLSLNHSSPYSAPRRLLSFVAHLATYLMATSSSVEKKGHVCPPSNAIHPADRWESLFVYSFICKFTNLRSKVEGLESPME